tara:strand:+ start:1136 stop:1459 length:324 start_codon:yes stop_codon:yes gene_type:complete
MPNDWDDDRFDDDCDHDIDEQPKKARGRPKGSFNKSSKAQIERVTANGGLSPLEYLASIYQNEAEEIRHRIDAAKAAAPFVHARLSSTEVKASVTEVSQEEWLSSLN